VKDGVEAYGTVSDNRHSLYVPVVLTLSNVYIDGKKTGDIDLIIYDGAVRGEFKEGLRLHIRGRLVDLIREGKRTPALAVIDGFNIELEKFRAGLPHFGSQIELGR